MARIGRVNDVDNCGLGGTIDLADEVFRTLGGDRQAVEIAGTTIDDIARAARGPDRNC